MLKKGECVFIAEALHKRNKVYLGGLTEIELRKIFIFSFSLDELKYKLGNILAEEKLTDLEQFRKIFRQRLMIDSEQILTPIRRQRLKEQQIDLNKKHYLCAHSYLLESSPAKVCLNGDPRDSEANVIEKQALLDAGLGEVWNSKLIRNPFPLLKENYFELATVDQVMLKKIFNRYYRAYRTVIENKIN